MTRTRRIEWNLKHHHAKMVELEAQGLSKAEASAKALDWLIAYRKGLQWAINECPESLLKTE